MIRIIPRNTPNLCGNCALVGPDCDCDCHMEAIVGGFHEKIFTKPLIDEKLTNEQAWLMGRTTKNPDWPEYLAKKLAEVQ